MLTICGGLFIVCGSKAIGFNAAGALGCVVLTIVANVCWKSSVQVSEVRREIIMTMMRGRRVKSKNGISE